MPNTADVAGSDVPRLVFIVVRVPLHGGAAACPRRPRICTVDEISSCPGNDPRPAARRPGNSRSGLINHHALIREARGGPGRALLHDGVFLADGVFSGLPGHAALRTQQHTARNPLQGFQDSDLGFVVTRANSRARGGRGCPRASVCAACYVKRAPRVPEQPKLSQTQSTQTPSPT